MRIFYKSKILCKDLATTNKTKHDEIVYSANNGATLFSRGSLHNSFEGGPTSTTTRMIIIKIMEWMGSRIFGGMSNKKSYIVTNTNGKRKRTK